MKRYQVLHCQNSHTGKWRKVVIDTHDTSLNRTRIRNQDTVELVCTTWHDTKQEANKSSPRREFKSPLNLRS